MDAADEIAELDSDGTRNTTLRPFTFRPILDEMKGNRGITKLAKSDLVTAVVQTIRTGGEQELHSHAGSDAIYFVLSGHVKFRGLNDMVANLGPHEGIFVPRGTPYCFEITGGQPAEILQIGAADKAVQNKFVLHGKSMGKPIDFEVFADDGKHLGDLHFDPKKK